MVHGCTHSSTLQTESPWNPVRVSVWNEDDDGVTGSRSIQPSVGLPSSSNRGYCNDFRTSIFLLG